MFFYFIWFDFFKTRTTTKPGCVWPVIAGCFGVWDLICLRTHHVGLHLPLIRWVITPILFKPKIHAFLILTPLTPSNNTLFYFFLLCFSLSAVHSGGITERDTVEWATTFSNSSTFSPILQKGCLQFFKRVKLWRSKDGWCYKSSDWRRSVDFHVGVLFLCVGNCFWVHNQCP